MTRLFSISVHGNVERLLVYQNKLDNPMTRRTKLERALKELKLVIREDSVLCERYIRGARPRMELDFVVNKVAQMRYLHEHCPVFIENIGKLRTERARDRQYLQANWEDGRAHDHFHDKWSGVIMVDQASAGIAFPAVWPWLN
jgi:hypothetical protein